MPNSKNLECTLYCYVEKDNREHAKEFGKITFGSLSAYINTLIAMDRGVAPKTGTWRAPGETAKIRRMRKNSERRRVSKRGRTEHTQRVPCEAEGFENHPGFVKAEEMAGIE